MTQRPEQAAEVLRVEGVVVRYGNRRVLDDVSFSVKEGEFTGLIGSNGAGKTTLLRVILGLQRPSAGRVDVGPAIGGRSHIGYVPQKVLFDRDLPLRARDLVALGIDGHRFGFPLHRSHRREAVEHMLQAVDALPFADARVGELSGGEQQRILIAHALVGGARLLLLDEPLASLDVRSTQEVIDLLHKVTKEHGVAVLMSTHEMNPLLPVMERLVYLASGRAASGTAEEVIRPEILARLYGHHVDVLRVHGRLIVVAGQGSGDEEVLAAAPRSVAD